MPNKLNLPKKIRNLVDRELDPEEYIEWIEQPIPRPFTFFSIFCVLFGIPFTFIGLPASIIIFGLPFLIVGLGFLLTPFWIWRAAKNTVYLVTDKRAISFEGGWSTTIKSYLPNQLQTIYRKERADGTGDVIFAIERWKDSDGDKQTKEVGFIGIRNPQEVEKMLKKLANQGQG